MVGNGAPGPLFYLSRSARYGQLTRSGHHGSDGPEGRLGPTSGATSGRIVHHAPPDEYVRFTRDLAREY